MENNLIDVDQFKKTFYRAYLPFEQINDYLQSFENHEVEPATQFLISLINFRLIDHTFNQLKTPTEKQKLLRLCQDDFSSPEIIDYINSKTTNLENLVNETVKSIISALAK
jgi:hypothetical protein